MKKKIWTLLTVAILIGTFSITALAGNINEAEQKIVTAISSVYIYNGAYYKVKDSYIEKVTNYLNRDDIDMTESEVESYLDQFYANISFGISSGYMECVGYVKQDQVEGKTTETDNSKKENGASEETPNQENVITEVIHTENGTIEVIQEENIAKAEIEQNKDNVLESDMDGIQEDSGMLLENQNIEETTITEEKQTMEPSETQSEEGKDYSDAEPFRQSISLGIIALAIVAIVATILTVIVYLHKNKRYKRK